MKSTITSAGSTLEVEHPEPLVNAEGVTTMLYMKFKSRRGGYAPFEVVSVVAYDQTDAGLVMQAGSLYNKNENELAIPCDLRPEDWGNLMTVETAISSGVFPIHWKREN